MGEYRASWKGPPSSSPALLKIGTKKSASLIMHIAHMDFSTDGTGLVGFRSSDLDIPLFRCSITDHDNCSLRDHATRVCRGLHINYCAVEHWDL